MARRRTAYYFTADKGAERDARIKVLAYGRFEGEAVAARNGWTNLRFEAKPTAAWRLDKAAARRLGREMGITWPLSFRTSKSRRTYGTCRTRFGERRHLITLSEASTDPEATIRHELGHALDNELRFAQAGEQANILLAQRTREGRRFGYYDSPAERAARSMERFRLDLKVTR